MDSRRYQALQLLKSALEEISIANGYLQDVAKVYAGRSEFGSEDETVPFLAILEKPEQPEIAVDGEDNFEVHAVTYLVQGWQRDDSQNPTKPAYELIADIHRRLRREKEDAFGSKFIQQVRVAPGHVRPDEDVQGYCMCIVEVTIFLVESFSDPDNV